MNQDIEQDTRKSRYNFWCLSQQLGPMGQDADEVAGYLYEFRIDANRLMIGVCINLSAFVFHTWINVTRRMLCIYV